MAADDSSTTILHLASGNGPITRTILSTPLRNASPTEIPIIDLSALSSSSILADRQHIATQIRTAATTNGFFYITNHGIDSTLISSAHSASLDFFRQDPTLKEPANTIHSTANKYIVGWKPPKTQKINHFEGADKRESFSLRYNPSWDPDAVLPLPDKIKQAIKVDEDGFPFTKTDVTVPHLKESIIPLYQAVLRLGRNLVRCFALALGLKENGFDNKFTYPDVSLAVNYYPPLDEVEVARNVSIGSHTDFQLFTILWQDDSGGLEVLTRQGQWLRAPPLKGTFVVNFADYMQRITNDKWVSTVHRVRNVSGGERISIPFFFGFNLDESCGTLDTCLEEGEEKKHEEISCWEWVERRIKHMNQMSKDEK
ncbi:2OG-Fe oxygenase family protein [Podospora fimiseda]|uniref:2OG-Fe oxygenase family protein n=1 Tax=Podospora fimiseda TaxID=252190 RepID=A0AAN6YN45_9PEZI|nr:2OG-Fe oxygenase family protein [Podospora fimiseda]